MAQWVDSAISGYGTRGDSAIIGYGTGGRLSHHRLWHRGRLSHQRRPSSVMTTMGDSAITGRHHWLWHRREIQPPSVMHSGRFSHQSTPSSVMAQGPLASDSSRTGRGTMGDSVIRGCCRRSWHSGRLSIGISWLQHRLWHRGYCPLVSDGSSIGNGTWGIHPQEDAVIG